MHADCGGSERVVRWEYKSAPVLAIVVRRSWWAGDNVMPLEDIRFRGVSDDIRRRILRDGFVFASQPLVSCSTRHRGRLKAEAPMLWFYMRLQGSDDG